MREYCKTGYNTICERRVAGVYHREPKKSIRERRHEVSKGVKVASHGRDYVVQKKHAEDQTREEQQAEPY